MSEQYRPEDVTLLPRTFDLSRVLQETSHTRPVEESDFKFMSADSGGFTVYKSGKGVGRVYQEKPQVPKIGGKWMAEPNYSKGKRLGPFPSRTAAAQALGKGTNEAKDEEADVEEKGLPRGEYFASIGKTPWGDKPRQSKGVGGFAKRMKAKVGDMAKKVKKAVRGETVEEAKGIGDMGARVRHTGADKGIQDRGTVVAVNREKRASDVRWDGGSKVTQVAWSALEPYTKENEAVEESRLETRRGGTGGSMDLRESIIRYTK